MLKLSMPILFQAENLKDNIELTICDSKAAKQAHKELFRFSDNTYIVADEKINIFDAVSGIVNACNSAPSCPVKIHIVLNWPNLLQISLWKATKPVIGDVFTLLKNTGVALEELQPFKTSDINDIFPWLYYGKRFDVLRKVCHLAKRKVESRFKGYATQVDCHIIAEDIKKIVASSL